MDAVSVIIPAFNYGRFVGRAVQSALDQTLAPAEIVVVDDGSTDDTRTVVDSFGPPVRLLRQSNRGVASARNTGVRATGAPLLAFLDADDAWHPGKLEAQVDRLRAEPGAGLVHCGVELVDGDGAIIGSETDGLQGWVAEELLLLERPVVLGGGSGALIPRPVFEAVGGFDERLSTSADWDLYLRVAASYPIAFVPAVLVRYSVHGSNMHRNVAAMEHDMRIGYAKAFASHPATLGRRRADAMANFFMMLGGSYFAAGDVRRACRAVAQSLRWRPTKVVDVVQAPVRRLARRRTAPEKGAH